MYQVFVESDIKTQQLFNLREVTLHEKLLVLNADVMQKWMYASYQHDVMPNQFRNCSIVKIIFG